MCHSLCTQHTRSVKFCVDPFETPGKTLIDLHVAAQHSSVIGKCACAFAGHVQMSHAHEAFSFRSLCHVRNSDRVHVTQQHLFLQGLTLSACSG